ncbi:AAA family ATPase [Streptomyces sp. NPDC056053]|uniref:AAA family ATPase n=1 Tax=Streptomyces sp. NPDC056053 TaxID=3345696 RepID=UPI0035D61FBC
MAPERERGDGEFVGRSWIVERALDHLARRGGEPLLIVGQPGSGKTALALELLNRIGPGDASTVVVGHLCRADDDDTLLGHGLVTALVDALIRRDGHFAGLTRAEPGPTLNATVTVGSAEPGAHIRGINVESLRLGAESARSAFNRLVRKPLENMPDPPAVVLVVDALDEARSIDSHENVITLLAHMTSGLRRTGLDFRILLTSREVEEPALRRIGGRRVHLAHDAPAGTDDVHDYCLARLTRDGSHLRAADRDGEHRPGARARSRRTLASRIAAGAAGNYLYARHVISSLDTDRQDADIDAVELPGDLGEVYDDFLDRAFASLAWRTVRPVLTLLAVARAPGMTAELLAAVTTRNLSDVEDALADIGEFTRREGDAVRIYHESFRTHLLSGTRHRVHPVEAHRAVGTAFLAGKADDPYLSRHYSHHLHRAGMHEELCAHVLATVGSPGTRAAAFSGADLEHLGHALASAVRTDDLTAVAPVLLRRAGATRLLAEDPLAVLADTGPEAARELAGAYPYEHGALWQLMIAHRLRKDGRFGECAEHLRWFDATHRDELPERSQGLAAVLLAGLQPEEGDDPATVHGAGLLDEFHTGMLARHLLDRGAVERGMDAAWRIESVEARAKLHGHALWSAAERTGPVPPHRVAERIAAELARQPYGRNATVEAVHAMALSWVPRERSGERPGMLVRLSRFPIEYSSALASVRPPVDTAARHEAERASQAMDLLRPRDMTPYERLWVDLNGARLARRSGADDLADGTMRRLLGGRPDLFDTEGLLQPVTPPHDDFVHGPCQQGLVLEIARECVRAGRVTDAEDLAREMLAFHGHDGVTIAVDLIRRFHEHGEGLRADAFLDDCVALLRERTTSHRYLATYLLRISRELSEVLPERRASELEAEAGRLVCELLSDRRTDLRFAPSGMAVLYARLAAAHQRRENGGRGEDGREDGGRVAHCVARALFWADPPDFDGPSAGGPDAGYESLAVHFSGVRDGAATRTAAERMGGRRAERVTAAADRLVGRGDRRGALNLLDAFGLRNDRARILVLAEQGRPEEALRQAMSPDVPIGVHLGLRRVLLDHGDTERADKLAELMLERLADLRKHGPAIGFEQCRRGFLFAELHARLGMYDEAVAGFRHAGALFADEAENWLAMNIPVGGDPYAPGERDDSAHDGQRDGLSETALTFEGRFAEAVFEGGHVDRARELVEGIRTSEHGRFGSLFLGSGPLALRARARTAAACGFLDLLTGSLDELPADGPAVAGAIASRAPETPYGRVPDNLRKVVATLAPYCAGDVDATLALCATLLDAAPEAADVVHREVRERLDLHAPTVG